MSYCCVPLRKSGSKKVAVSKGISFHEFPCDINVRTEWIKAIGRKDPKTNDYWCPKDFHVVCGLHFAPEQYRIGIKRKMLLPGSVPCIFPKESQDLLQNSTLCKRVGDVSSKNVIKFHKKRKNNLIQTNKIKTVLCDEYVDANNSDIVNVEENGEEANSDVNSNTEENVELSYSGSSFKEGQNSEGSSETIINEDHNIVEVLQSLGLHPIRILGSTTNSADQINAKNVYTEASHRSVLVDNYLQRSSKIPITGNILNVNSSSSIISSSGQNISPSVEHSGFFNNDNFMYPITIEEGGSSVKENCVMPSRIDKNTIRSNVLRNAEEKKLKTQLESAKRQNRRYKAQLLKLRNENKKYHLLNKIITEKLKHYNIEELEKGIDNKDAKALFLFDQLRSLTKERILWSQSTMEFVNSFEKTFPKSYSFLRDKNIINLPCRKILRFDLEESDVDSDSNSQVQ